MQLIETWLEEKIDAYERARNEEARETKEDRRLMVSGVTSYHERNMTLYDAKYQAYKDLLQLIHDGSFSNVVSL